MASIVNRPNWVKDSVYQKFEKIDQALYDLEDKNDDRITSIRNIDEELKMIKNKLDAAMDIASKAYDKSHGF
jgi:vesicle coat complex subunit